jgi:hypothetical protein
MNKINKTHKEEKDKLEETNSIYSLLRNSLEYYDTYQPKIQEILDKIDYIKIIDGININDTYIFYDSNHNEIFKSRIETLSIFIPQTQTWKWSWSVPFAKFTNTHISRKILEYAFTLNTTTDLILKSTLVDSNIKISNQYQIDIYLALSAMLSKKPFVLKLYLVPMFENKIIFDNTETSSKSNLLSTNPNEQIYYYKKIIDNPEKNNFISIYSLIIDWK